MHYFLKFIIGMKLYMFQTVPLFVIRSFSLYTQQWYMLYRFADSLHIPLLCVQWKTPNDGQRNCPKHVEFHSKNKLEKIVHLVGFIKRCPGQVVALWCHNELDCNWTNFDYIWCMKWMQFWTMLLQTNENQIFYCHFFHLWCLIPR